MPVYVTRAHVTIGDAKKNSRREPLVPRRAFHLADITRTPYCLRMFFVTFVGLAVVAGGVIMTMIGYKPGILLPWFRENNTSIPRNTSDPSAIPRLLGEPGPLRILVYIGPIFMGLGAFSMMVSVVLFCEIKDRYFNNILPKTAHQRHKDSVYDKIIAEFRKNYFRGIEVPLQPPQRKRSKGRLSFSLSGSGSLLSFGRRLSHDFQKRKRERRLSREREIHSERVAPTKHKRIGIREILESNDSWMKTSSLPNIGHRGEHYHCACVPEDCEYDTSSRAVRSCEPTVFKPTSLANASGVVNQAYKDSPPDKHARRFLTKHASLETDADSTRLTTVIVHRESTLDSESERASGYLPELRCPLDREPHSRSPEHEFSVIDIDKDIELLPKLELDNETTPNIPSSNSNCLSVQDEPENNDCSHVCTCGTDVFCQTHALGMDSGGSSLSLSWENIPSEWNDARRNTEPMVLPHKSLDVPNCSTSEGTDDVSSIKNSLEGKSTRLENENRPSSGSNNHVAATQRHRSSAFRPYKTSISVCKSDTNLLRVGTYSFLRSNQGDTISLDSLNLTDDMLKHFEQKDSAYI